LWHVTAVCRFVEDDVDAIQRDAEIGAVADITHDVFRVRIAPCGRAVAVRLRLVIVEHTHAPPPRNEQLHDVGADQPRAAGSERRRHAAIPPVPERPRWWRASGTRAGGWSVSLIVAGYRPPPPACATACAASPPTRGPIGASAARSSVR